MAYDPVAVAGLLACGFNEWIRAYGPGTGGARAEAGRLVVVHDGVEYDVTIRRSAAERDTLIHEAAGDEMSNTEVASHMGINRGTVIRVLGSDNETGSGKP